MPGVPRTPGNEQTVNGLIAYCGINCLTCPVHVATLTMDEAKRTRLRESVATICREKYGMTVTFDDITDCDGCGVPGGRLFSGCAQCRIRTCVERRHLGGCAQCTEFGCGLLREQWKDDPEAEARLAEIRTKMLANILGGSGPQIGGM